LGTIPCTTTYIDENHLTCLSPAAPTGANYIGKVDLTVINPDGQFSKVANAYLYLGDPEMWLSGDFGITQSAGNVTLWTDRSAYSNHATARGGIDAPTYQASLSTLNGKPAVHFDGAAGLSITRLDRHQGLSGQSFFGVGVTDTAATTSQSFYWFSTSGANATRSNFQIADNGFSYAAQGSMVGPVNFSGRTLDAEGTIVQVLGGNIATGVGFLASGTVDYLNQTVRMYQDRGPTVVATNFQNVGPMSSTAAADGCIGCASSWGRYFNGSISEIIYRLLLSHRRHSTAVGRGLFEI
jgi:hypothetical protein